jgi:hypothetical protein
MDWSMFWWCLCVLTLWVWKYELMDVLMCFKVWWEWYMTYMICVEKITQRNAYDLWKRYVLKAWTWK